MVGPMAGQVSGQPLSPGDVRGDRETRLTEHGDKGWSGYSLASVTRECTGQPGETMYKTWSPRSARLLADLGRPEMYGATGRLNEVRALILIRCPG